MGTNRRVMTDKKVEPEKPVKGSKSRRSRTGLPKVDLIDAMGYGRKVYNISGTNVKTFQKMADDMGIDHAYAKVAFGFLADYGLIDKVGVNWRITEFGKKAIGGDRNTVEQMLRKNKIMDGLFNEFTGSIPERDVLEQHIKRKYPTLKANYIADRYVKALEYLNTLGAAAKSSLLEIKPEWYKIMQLKYALNPPKENEIADLARELAEDLKTNEDEAVSIKVLAGQMENNLDNRHALTLLINSIFEILAKEHPEFFLTENETEGHVEKAE